MTITGGCGIALESCKLNGFIEKIGQAEKTIAPDIFSRFFRKIGTGVWSAGGYMHPGCQLTAFGVYTITCKLLKTRIVWHTAVSWRTE